MRKPIRENLDNLVEKMAPEVEERRTKIVQTEDAIVLLSWESDVELVSEVVQCDRSEVGLVDLPLPEGEIPKRIANHILHKTVSAIADIYGRDEAPDKDKLYPVRWENGIVIFGFNDKGLECRRVIDTVTDMQGTTLFEKAVLN